MKNLNKWKNFIGKTQALFWLQKRTKAMAKLIIALLSPMTTYVRKKTVEKIKKKKEQEEINIIVF